MKIPQDIKSLEEKINNLMKKESDLLTNCEPISYSKAMQTVLIIITELIASIVVGAGIGYGLDYVFSTTPLFMVVFLLFGSIAGFVNVYRIVKYQEEQATKEKEE